MTNAANWNATCRHLTAVSSAVERARKVYNNALQLHDSAGKDSLVAAAQRHYAAQIAARAVARYYVRRSYD